MARRLQAVAMIMLAGLAACATMKPPESPQQMAAAAAMSSDSSAVVPGTTTSPSPQRVSPSGDNFSDRLPDRVLFAYDKSELDPEALNALQQQAAFLTRFPNVIVVIEGHSDERGTREYNLALGARRADAVRAYLVTHGINAARIDTVSYGKERPACAGFEELCWKLNRRAVSMVNIDATNGRN